MFRIRIHYNKAKKCAFMYIKASTNNYFHC